MKQVVVNILLHSYHKIIRRNFLRVWIKKLIGESKIIIDYKGIRLFAGTSSAIESNLIFNSYNEAFILELIGKYAEKNYTFVDIGANIGLHSLTAAKANKAIDIFSFEPESTNFKHFVNNMSLNPFSNIRPFHVGLGNFNGVSELNINEGWNKGKHSLKVNFNESSTKIKIPVATLDSFTSLIEKQHVLIKIDVEGFEKEVIQGAEKFFQKTVNSVLIIELLTEVNGEINCKEIVANLSNFGFSSIYKITGEKTIKLVADFDGSADYIFVKGNATKDSLLFQ